MFKNCELEIKGFCGGERFEIRCDQSFSTNQLEVTIENGHENNNAIHTEPQMISNPQTISKAQSQRLKVTILPKKPITLDSVELHFKYAMDPDERIFVNGYQSWTDSREFSQNETLRTISKLAAPVMNKYQFDKYGDYNFVDYQLKKGEFHGFTYGYMRLKGRYRLLGSLTERSGFTLIKTSVKDKRITMAKDCKGLEITQSFEAFDLIFAEGDEAQVFDAYFGAMNLPAITAKPMKGWTSWYNYYQNISQYILESHLNDFEKDVLEKRDFAIDIFQIDDGYQTAVGDWLSVDKTKFPDGMKAMADQIKSKGFKAGIWLAPFVCEKNSQIYKEHFDWILKDAKDLPVMAGSNWSGFFSLDLENPEVKAYIQKVFTVVLDDWGYDLVKLDFLYAACIVPRPGKPRGQLMCEAMDFLRDCVKDKEILGCGVPLGPSFGKVDYCRIGCDVGLDWDDNWLYRHLHRERVSTLNAIQNSIGRRQLSGRAFLNDPDVFLLRTDRIDLNSDQKRTLALVNLLFGQLMFTSDAISAYGPEQRFWYERAMGLKERAILSVEFPQKHLVRIIYREAEKNNLVLINLGSKNELYKEKDLLNRKIKLSPYESQEFRL